jgi:hypothetical protein
MKAAVPIVALTVPLVLLGGLGEARAQDAVGRVRIDGPDGTRFEQETDSLHGEWETVCTAPCVAQVSTAFNYRVARWDMKSSKGFSLRVDEGQTEELHVDGASYVLWGLGWAVLGTGVAATVTGLFIGLLSATGDAIGAPKATTDPALGWIVMGAGVAAAIGGLVLVLTNKHTTVSQDVVEARQAPQLAAAIALPMPRFGPVETSASFVQGAPAFGLPIVSFRF